MKRRAEFDTSFRGQKFDRLPNLSTVAADSVTSMADSNNIDGITSARDNVKIFVRKNFITGDERRQEIF